jgi:ribosomal protein L21E
MVDTTEFEQGKYLNAELAETSPSKKVYIKSDATIVDGKYGRKLEVQVELDGMTKTWNPNIDQVKELNKAFGKDSKLWVGRWVELKVFKVGDKKQISICPIVIKEERVV